MLNFVFILFIIFEIILSVILIDKIKKAEKQILELNEKVINFNKVMLLVNSKVINIIKKTNKVIAILTNKRFIQIKQILSFAISTIEILFLIKNIKKQKTMTLKSLKKLLIPYGIKIILKKVLMLIFA